MDKKAIDSGNRISRQEVFLESDLGEESFEAAYTYLRRELYVGAPINEEELWLTSSGVNFYENKRELRRKIPKRNILGILGLIVAVIATIYFPVANDRDWRPFTDSLPTPRPPDDVIVVVSLVNNTEEEVYVQSFFRYQFVEAIGPSFRMGPWVAARPRLLESQQPLTSEILIERKDRVGLLVDIKMNAAMVDWLHTGGKTLFVGATLRNGVRVEGSIPFKRDIIDDFPVSIFVDERID